MPDSPTSCVWPKSRVFCGILLCSLLIREIRGFGLWYLSLYGSSVILHSNNGKLLNSAALVAWLSWFSSLSSLSVAKDRREIGVVFIATQTRIHFHQDMPRALFS